jgi:outer membrane protein OmpA-like peptidoglycan-associated protein
MPAPVTLTVGELPAKINAVLFQMFLDDFQGPVWHSHFQVTINGTRIPTFEAAVNSLQQTGPTGKLVSLKLLPEYWPLLRSGTVKLLIDDPTTHAPDGYAIDFVRILVNPHAFEYAVSLNATVVDADKHTPIAGATVTAAITSESTDAKGACLLKGLPAGLATASAIAPGYDEAIVPVDLEAGTAGRVNLELHRHKEGVADLERSIGETGSAVIYGVHFDVNSATLRPDSVPALQNVLAVINKKPDSTWVISGHTDNQGAADLNQRLSQARAASVIAWLSSQGVAAARLTPQGFGPNRPVADNATEAGRALNRRVEIMPK